MDEKSIIIQKFEKIFTNRSECYDIWLKVASDTLNKYFHGKRGRAYKAEDVVQEVILKIIEGVRKWDFKEYPNLTQFMIWNIKSFIHSLYKKEKYHNYFEDISDYNNDSSNTIILPAFISPEDIELNYELMEKIKIFYERLEAEKEFECLKVIDYMRLEYKNSEVAKRLNIKPSEVVNIKKRIKNRLKFYFDNPDTGFNQPYKRRNRTDKNYNFSELRSEEFLDNLLNEHKTTKYFMVFRTKNKKKK